MSASASDLITDTRNAGRPVSTTVATARASGATTLACTALTYWPTASKVHFVTYQVDSNSNPVLGTQLDCEGIVVGNSVTSLVINDGTDNGNSVGDVVEMLPTANWGQDLADALTAEHNRTGTHTTAVLQSVYPVGSIYINASVATNPGTLLGFGTWTAFGAGKVPVGIDSTQTEFDTAEETGGEKTHTLTGAESGTSAHLHPNTGAQYIGVVVQSGTGAVGMWGGNISTNSGTSAAASASSAHNNLQPYVVVYMWKRAS
jgi:hypothetical protein